MATMLVDDVTIEGPVASKAFGVLLCAKEIRAPEANACSARDATYGFNLISAWYVPSDSAKHLSRAYRAYGAIDPSARAGRVTLHVAMDTENTNQMVEDGTIGPVMDAEQLQPAGHDSRRRGD